MNRCFKNCLRNTVYIVLMYGVCSCALLSLVEKKRSVRITSEYIENDYWYEYNRSFTVSKLVPKHEYITNLTIDSIIGSYQPFFLQNFEENVESQRVGYLNKTKVKFSSRRVFFNKYNGFNWYKMDREHNDRIFGNLHLRSWYLFTGLFHTSATYVYAYIDEMGNGHLYTVSLSNY